MTIAAVPTAPQSLTKDNAMFGLRRPSFPRVILPALAVVAIIAAIIMVATSQPDRTLKAAADTPPRAPQRAGATVAGAGLIEPSSETIAIGSDVGGIVDRILVEPGRQVTPGQLLFTIDSRQVRASLREAESAVIEARAALANAEAGAAAAVQQLALYRGVEDARAISRLEVIQRQGLANEARTRVTLARAQVVTAEARAASVRTQLARHEIRAPIAAEVLRVSVRLGEFVQAGGPQAGAADAYLQIGATRPLHVRIDIDEDEVDRLQLGGTAQIAPRGDARRTVPAQFVRVEPQIVPKRSLTNATAERVDVRVLQAIFVLPEDAQGFFVGQQVDAFLPARDPQSSGANQ
ncbi:MAG: efflux RND transporter periplasmic adaptor subunit [Sphingomonadaceae bacterium]